MKLKFQTEPLPKCPIFSISYKFPMTPAEIREAILKCKGQDTVIFSRPGRMIGRFSDSDNDIAESFTTDFWEFTSGNGKVFKIAGKDIGGIKLFSDF
jgi:hypothetical protein